MIRVVALDFDGVILESNEAKTQAFAALMEDHGPEASRAMALYHIENRGVSRYLKFDWFYQAFLGRRPTPDESSALNNRFNALSMEAILSSSFVPGIMNFLESCLGRIPLYVVSGTPTPELRHIVARKELAPFFVDVLGTPTCKADHLRVILEREAIAAQELLMVGDADTDLRAALEVGARFYGRGDFPDHACGPDLTGLGDFMVSCGARP